MLRTTLRSLWEHKRRLLSTIVAVLLGVAFMSGTLVLGDTLDSSFDSLFEDINDEVDAEVRGPELFDTGFGLIRGPLDASVVDSVADVDGVAAATGNIASSGGRILGADGEPIGATNGPPTLLANWVDDPGLSGVELSEGRGPESDDELALNVGAATDGELSVGDTVDVASAEGRESYTLVGTFTIAGRDSAGGTVFGAFTTATAQSLAGLPDQFQTVTARTDENISQEELVARIAPAIPEGAEVVTGEVAGQEMADAISGGLSFFTTFLMIFAVIALAVGAFIIYNTFSILVAQRGRELALMRAIGASRSQVLMSVLVEAALVGLIAAVLGIGAGILLAIGVQALLGAFGLDLPTEGLTVSPSTIVIALVAGLAVTFFSAVVPAWRATKVPPIAALRDVAQDTSGTSKIRAAIGLALVVLAGVCLAPAFGEDPSGDALRLVGLGGLILLVALIVLGPVLARPLSLAFGWPISRLKGTTGQLAQQNAARSPKRTASTAAALMIGVALVAFISIFAASASASIDSELSRGFDGDFVIQSDAFDVGIPLSVADDVRALDGVAEVASQRQAVGKVAFPDGGTSDAFLGAVQPEQFGELVNVTMDEGALTDLIPGTIVIDSGTADDHGVAIGDTVTITYANGTVAESTVVALSDDQLLGSYTLHVDDWTANVPNQTDTVLFVAAEPDADLGAVHEAIDAIVEPFPTVNAQDRDEFLGSVRAQLTAALNIVYGLLFLSILIALIGIANTLSLSIHERTRELGLLRAVGMSRRQLKSSVHWEAVIIALIGTLLGLGLGFVLSYSLVTALEPEGFTTFAIPVTRVVVITIGFAALGIVAAFFPARRAAKLNILDAIATE